MKPITIVLLGSMLMAAKPADRLLTGGFKAFETPVPESSGQWDSRKPELRAKLWELLGDMPPLFTPEVMVHIKEQFDGYTTEKFSFDNGVGDRVYGYFVVPTGHSGRGPAILYNHYHGGRYTQGKEELFMKAFEGIGHSLETGKELVKQGYVICAIDAYAFGERRFQGPKGREEEGRETEESLFRAFIWQGKTLWGMMVRDDLLALNYLLSRPEVDPERVAAMGMSMGSTRSWWAAALDDRIKCVVSVACLTRYQDLIRTGDVRKHGIDIESVVGLIAPRPHLTLTGDSDERSPVSGVRTINAFQTYLYQLYGRQDEFVGEIYEDTGHVYTDEMWTKTLQWLDKHLKRDGD